MIQEIINFVDYLNENSPEVFSENLELKEGLYIFLEKEGGELVIKEENILKVDKNHEKNELYNQFLEKVSNTEMLNAMKSFNSGPKVYITIGSPFGIAISGKGWKENAEKKLLDAAEAYFKAAQKFMDIKKEHHVQWMHEIKYFVFNKMIPFLAGNEEYRKVKDSHMFYFFHKEPAKDDYNEIQSRFLSEKLFNKDKFNIKAIDGEIYGISDNLNGFNDSKSFLKHQTASFELNYRINGYDAKKLYQFFRLQQKNKILPNPMPIFVDKDEIQLSEKAITFYKSDTKRGHKEIIEYLLKEKEGDLHNYYLIYFHNGQKGSRIIDLDFVPVFKYTTDDMPEIKTVFNVISKEKGNLFKNYKIENIFDFQTNILNITFNKQLIQETKNGLWLKYFDDIEVNQYASETIVHLFYKYRKALYDFVYKSKRQAITFDIFYDIMSNSILDDIAHDKGNNKTFSITEKLNIWFSLYNYFVNSKNKIDMVNKTEQLFEKINQIAKNEKLRLQTDEEFAFACGQLIRTILNKSESSDRSHSLLEPFLQKTEPKLFKLAIARTFETYKHAFQFYKGNSRYEFDKIISEVMGFEPTEKNMKNLLPLILAGYFSETVFKKEVLQENN